MKSLSLYCLVGCALLLPTLNTPIAHSQTTSAPIAPDPTLATIVSSSDQQNFTISGGSQMGGNLFHSFRDFSVPTNGAARFSNASTVVNIFSRITGSNPSHIDGLIQAQGNANLFLLNPNGILFGNNARLDIGGSLIATTADRIQFADGTFFAAQPLQSSPLLTISAPIGLQFGANPGAIAVQGAGHRFQTHPDGSTIRSSNVMELAVAPNKTLALIGGSVNLQGGILAAPSGQIAIGAVGKDATVALSPVATGSQSTGFQFNYGAVTSFQPVLINRQSLLDVSADRAGSIHVHGQTVHLKEGSLLLSQAKTGIPGQGIFVTAADEISISGNSLDNVTRSGVRSEALVEGLGATIQIQSRRFSLQGGSTLRSSSYQRATSGDIRVVTSEEISLTGVVPLSNISSSINAWTYGAGKSGDVMIATQSLFLADGTLIGSFTRGSGDAGKVSVNASEAVTIVGTSPILQPTGISSGTLASGNAGSLEVTTSRLVIRDGGRVDSSTIASGNAGSVTIHASESVEVRGAIPNGQVVSQIVSAGSILEESLRIRLVDPNTFPTGEAGNVTVNTPKLTISDRAQVSVVNDGSGNGGKLEINTTSLQLHRNGHITARTRLGSGGNINLTAQTVLLRQGSLINSEAGGTGNGGNITINAPMIIGLENSDIIANAIRGEGGKINITTQALLGLKYRDRLTLENDITASSEFGLSGNVQVNTIGTEPSTSLTELSTDLVDASQRINTTCAAKSGSQFVMTGRGGMAPDPNNRVVSDRFWTDLRPIPMAPSHTMTATSTHPQPLLEASHFQHHPDGTLELAAAPLAATNALATCALANR
jgi:filamentous hemagglutinin family protein